MKKCKILYFLFISLSCLSQTGKLNGKLILKDPENYKKVSENTFIILKDGKRIDSVKVDDKLAFNFKKLSTDTLKIFVSPKGFPVNRYYIISLKENEIKNFEIPYSSVCPFSKNTGNICPVCKKNDKVLPIVYGFTMKIKYRDKNGNPINKYGKVISKEEDEKITSKSGGCVVSDCQPNWFCELDQIDF